MALNWYLQIRNLSKTDPKAAEILEQLKNAGTDNEKDSAKQAAIQYITESTHNEEPAIDNSKPGTEEETAVAENQKVVSDPDIKSDSVVFDTTDTEDGKRDQEAEVKTDLSQPAFAPRLAKFGITREEELFLKGVFVRKMNREDKILMRRSIYQKKTQGNAKIQAEFKAKRIAQKQADLNDPEKIKFHQERKYVSAIVDALTNHKNLGWIFSQIEGLTPETLRELIAKPGNYNAIRQANPNFIENFNKKYGG
jgi:hypothetical protein